jgi:hypothetical protein
LTLTTALTRDASIRKNDGLKRCISFSQFHFEYSEQGMSEGSVSSDDRDRVAAATQKKVRNEHRNIGTNL